MKSIGQSIYYLMNSTYYKNCYRIKDEVMTILRTNVMYHEFRMIKDKLTNWPSYETN